MFTIGPKNDVSKVAVDISSYQLRGRAGGESSIKVGEETVRLVLWDGGHVVWL